MRFWRWFFWLMFVIWTVLGIVSLVIDADAESRRYASQMGTMFLIGAVLLTALRERQS